MDATGRFGRFFTRRRLLLSAAGMLLPALTPLAGASRALAAGSDADSSAAAPVRIARRKIPSTGELLPVVGCGTWRTFDVGDDRAAQDRLADVLRVLFASGGSVIDSSPMYGSSEAVVGTLLTRLAARDSAFVATKVWTEGRDAGIGQMEQSMRRLQTSRIDLMQVHNLLDWRTQLATLRDWKAAGRIRYLGVTHYTSGAFAQVEAVMRAERPDFVQINYAADDRDAEARILPLAADLGIAVIVNQPFGGGGLLARVSRQPLPAWAAEIGCTTWAQLLLKFVLAHPAVTVVIPGTGRPEYMRDNVRAGLGAYPDAALRSRIVAAVGG
ncbi:aldo/keto reductase [Paraburkholderia caballeronis]|uniref:Aldo/keto reductase n=1 Tax=Paraburkholderia caballeronis TaxID=416943 RepID=A0A1H7RZV9_9BURK|nr:aldo/keto reductase [Paraburkholderia caballeronis]PXW22811.1 diketogulonate reductase-like aldo/keto reductase [Paraburkholderia caballeronis]PXW97196.1 diketogulonate reductase-like aldo/keto reductase [Paraburkholderia caballeronis]RAJ93716.1 diketogulonate reductase-like aldo/keto reductase [Paraburkholderia caballeronis]SED62289.1 Aldo/keto reductase [Paraburkholderia caballeronis]SEL65745.1 Aldo/keto reductase [Paraburkholderia caballeronis]